MSREQRRITIEVDLSSLGFQELNAVTAALATLEELGKQGIVTFSVTSINAPRKRRSDANTEIPPLQPQTQKVLDYLSGWPDKEFMAKEVAKALRIKSDGVNGQLHALFKRGLVSFRKIERPQTGVGRRNVNVWKAQTRGD